MTVLTTDHARPAPSRAPLPLGWVEPRDVPQPRLPEPAPSPVAPRPARRGTRAGRRPAGTALTARPTARPLRPSSVPARSGAWSCERVHVRRRVGALVVVGLLAAVVVVALALLGSTAGSDGVPQGTAVVQVQQGETLWEVAQRVAPEASTAAVVDRIRELNDMRGAVVHPGQPLVVPAG